jgi:hypothetical protein
MRAWSDGKIFVRCLQSLEEATALDLSLAD